MNDGHDISLGHLRHDQSRSEFLTPEEHGRYWHDLAQERIAQNASLRSAYERLKLYVREQRRLSDKSSHDWELEGSHLKTAYHSGMAYAYRDIENRLGPLPNDQTEAPQ